MSNNTDMTPGSGNSGIINRNSTINPLPIFYNPTAIMGQSYLTKENYVNWSTLFKTLLRTHSLLFVIEPQQPAATLADGSTNPQHAIWKEATDLVCGWIKGTVTPAVQPYLNSSATAPEAWAVLAKRFGETSALQIETLKEKLHDLKKNPDTSIADYLLQASQIADALTTAGDPVDDAVLIQRICGGLGQEYKEFLTSIAAIHARNPLTMDLVTDLLLKEEMLLQKFATPAVQTTALVATKLVTSGSSEARRTGSSSGGGQSRGKGPNRGGRGGGQNRNNGNRRGNNGNRGNWHNNNNNKNFGYGRGNGWSRGGFPPASSRGHFGNNGSGILPTPVVKCQWCYKFGHSARECQDEAAYMAYSDPYILDSGATNHMTSDPSSFSGSYPYPGQSDEGDSHYGQ